MNILEIAQEAADICAVARPGDLFNAKSQNDQLFASVVKSTLSSLMRHAEWQMLVREALFSTTPGTKDYLIENIAPDFHSLINATVYSENDTRNVVGAITEQKWSKLKQNEAAQTDFLFKIQNNMFRFLDDPGTLQIRFAYKSNAVCLDAQTGTPKSQLSANTDIPIFDEYLVKLGIIWRWNKRTGLDYGEEYFEYEKELAKSFAETKAVGDINLAGPQCLADFSDITGGVIVNAQSKC